jgi:hypothetical protein
VVVDWLGVAQVDALIGFADVELPVVADTVVIVCDLTPEYL